MRKKKPASLILARTKNRRVAFVLWKGNLPAAGDKVKIQRTQIPGDESWMLARNRHARVLKPGIYRVVKVDTSPITQLVVKRQGHKR